MSEEVAVHADAADAASASGRVGLWQRFLYRFVPAGERPDALWIIGVAALLSCIRAFAYHPMQSYIVDHVFSPRVEELGFALRATAIADVVWGAFAGIFILLVLRFTKAPKATALYIVLAGLLLAVISLGNRLALDAVLTLSGSEYRRSLLSDLQPMMLAAAEAVGVVIGAWAAQLMSGEERPADGSTFLPAMGWTGTPLVGATWMAVGYATVRAVGQLASGILAFVPLAAGIFGSVRGLPPGTAANVPSSFATAASVASFVLIGYLGVKRLGTPVTIWLAFLAAGLPGFVAALAFLPSQLAAIGWAGGARDFAFSLFALVAWPTGAIAPFFGVWAATRPARVSEPSATLPEDNDHW